ncbi:hypothetical protein [Streptomyces sp. NPDC006879]|uniref:hypothetical protein n=1 Tax=Streptomyces sp. NPDC006879 TaxID=3364767 RepID=UPI0036CF87CA
MADDGTTGPEREPRRPTDPDPERSELEQLRGRVAALEADQAARTPHHRWRSFFCVLLIVIGCLLAPLAGVAAWTSSQVGDTDRYVATVAPLASDPDIQAAVANRVTNEVMKYVDVPSLLETAAPADRPRLEKALGLLGNSLEGAVRSFVQDRTQDIIASGAFEQIWTEANRRIHTAVVKALTGSDNSTVNIQNDSVTLDLGPLVEQVKQRLIADGMTLASNIPEVHTEFTILQADNIGKVKTAFRLLEIVGFWLPVLSVLFLAAGVLLAQHRRRVLITAALCLALAMLVLGAALTIFRVVYLNALPDSVSQPAAESVYDILTRYLRTTVRTTVAAGVVVALAAWLTGPSRWATLSRQLWDSGIHSVRDTADRAGLRTAPVGAFVRNRRGWITWILVAVTVLVYFLWSYPTGWVVIGLALTLLFALAVVEFLAAEPEAGAPPPKITELPDDDHRPWEH